MWSILGCVHVVVYMSVFAPACLAVGAQLRDIQEWEPVCVLVYSGRLLTQHCDLWPTPCCAVIVLLVTFHWVRSSQSIHQCPWGLMPIFRKTEENRREAMKQVCCQQTDGIFIILSLPGQLDLLSANFTVAFSSTWPSWLSGTLSSKCRCLTPWVTNHCSAGSDRIISSSNPAVNDLTHGLLTTLRNPHTVNYLSFHIMPTIHTLWKAWSQWLHDVILQ